MEVLMTSQQIKNIENSAFADGVAVELLMDRAGSALAEEVEKAVENRTHENLIVLCGKGNNGGDGYVIARLLGAAGYKVQVVATAPPRTESAGLL